MPGESAYAIFEPKWTRTLRMRLKYNTDTLNRNFNQRENNSLPE